jgi:hypothetical protein
MRHLQPWLRSVAALLLLVFPAELLPSALCFGRPGEAYSVENVRASKKGQQVQVLYNLSGETGKAYSITVTLRREGDITYKYSPKNVSGDVGDGVTPGTDRKILWDPAEEFPEGMSGDDYYFLVEAEPPGGGISPLVWVGGAVVAGGAAVLLLGSKKGSDGSTTTPPAATGFPAEPGRPTR